MDKQLNEDGSTIVIYNYTTYPSIYIFDDLYTKPNDHWVVNFMDIMACMSRHRKTSCFIAFQGFSRLSNKILGNTTRIFLFYDILGREDLWRKMKITPPSNLSEVLRDVQMGMHTRRYYLDDDSLVEYVPYELSNKQQAMNKMGSKLPKALSDKQKKKTEVEEKQQQVQQLEEELNIKKTNETKDSKARMGRLCRPNVRTISWTSRRQSKSNRVITARPSIQRISSSCGSRVMEWQTTTARAPRVERASVACALSTT